MEDAIRRIIKQIIKEPLLKSAFEEELKELNSNNCSDFHSNEVGFKVNIDKDCHVTFVDYPDLEIPSYQAQTLYIFYLLIPQGISNEELVAYEKTLIKIYKQVCKYKIGDDYRAQNVIRGMLLRKGGISDATNKIRKAFREKIINPKEFDQYVIKGNRKGKRLIDIPKEKIKIECDFLSSLKEEIKKLHKN
ncbi:hypothetical protein LJB98_04930 [Bacteroidales bacterium OttesenSCG-928-M11]|nr:hypothetical protein [Bacteroidales bacterium OttesenSCG-928-M11]